MLAFAVAEAFAGGGVHSEAGCEAFGFGGGDGLSIEVAWLLGSVLAQESVDAAGEVGDDGAECLVVVASALDDHSSVEVSELRVVLAGDVSRETNASSAACLPGGNVHD